MHPAAESEHRSSPLRDPRAIGLSLGLHLTVLAMASLIAVAGKVERPHTVPPLQVEVEPIDTRALDSDDTQGGGPGELGGQGRSVPVRLGDTSQRDPALAAYLAQHGETQPDGTATPLPEPHHGVGVIPGPGLGGGGGSGGGSGGGTGRGVGPGTEFFGIQVPGRSFCFLIDRSGSMSNHRKLEIARLELIESLRLLAPGTRFGVLFYNLDVERLVGPQLLVATTAASRTEAERRLESVHAMGGTDHVKALRAAFATGAEVVFYLTDGQRLTPTDTERLLKETRGAKVQVIEFGMGPPSPVANPSRILAEKSGGQYRYVNVRDLEGLSDP